jgi:DNA-binding transcriptional LysR family regulator
MAGAQRWAALEIRLISAFVAVVEKGSFAAAARELGYTQSGVSQQVAALERIADCRLLIRHAGGRRPVQPTAAGRAMLEHSRALLAQIDRAYDDVNGRTNGEGNTVRVVAFSSFSVHILPRLLIELRKRGDTRVEVLEDSGEVGPFDELDSGVADLAFAVLPVPARFGVEELGSDPYVAVVPAGSELASKSRIRIEDLRGRQLLGVAHCANEDVLEARFAAAGLDEPGFERYEDNQLVQSLVAGDQGVAVVPWLTVNHDDSAVRVLPLAIDLPPLKLGLIHHRDRLLSPAAREFRNLAVELSRKALQQQQQQQQDAAAKTG